VHDPPPTLLVVPPLNCTHHRGLVSIYDTNRCRQTSLSRTETEVDCSLLDRSAKIGRIFIICRNPILCMLHTDCTYLLFDVTYLYSVYLYVMCLSRDIGIYLKFTCTMHIISNETKAARIEILKNH